MTKQLVLKMIAAVIMISGLVFISGCQNDAMTGGAIGSLAGAGIGQLAGGDTEATLIGAAIGAGAGIPLVYCMVMNPKKSGISGSDVTGVTLDIPIARQFEAFKSVVPSLKKIGLKMFSFLFYLILIKYLNL